MTFERLKLGDEIIDLEMSKRYGTQIICTITAIKDDKMVVNNPFYSRHYPHSFFKKEFGIKWETLK